VVVPHVTETPSDNSPTEPSKLHIRAVADTERDVWQSLFQSYADFYQVDLPENAADNAWAWIHDSNEPFWCDLVIADETIVGFTQYQLMHRSLSGERVVYLSDLFVKPAARGLGAAKLLIDHVFDFARARNISNVRWLTQDFNYRARALYDSYGKKSDFILYSFPV